jgi:hypothetical protein
LLSKRPAAFIRSKTNVEEALQIKLCTIPKIQHAKHAIILVKNTKSILTARWRRITYALPADIRTRKANLVIAAVNDAQTPYTQNIK